MVVLVRLCLIVFILPTVIYGGIFDCFCPVKGKKDSDKIVISVKWGKRIPLKEYSKEGMTVPEAKKLLKKQLLIDLGDIESGKIGDKSTLSLVPKYYLAVLQNIALHNKIGITYEELDFLEKLNNLYHLEKNTKTEVSDLLKEIKDMYEKISPTV